MLRIKRYISRHYYISLISPLVFLFIPLQGYTADISELRTQILKVCPQNNLTGRECAIATQKAVDKLPDDTLLSLLNNIGAARFQLQAETQSGLRPLKQARFGPAQYPQQDQSLPATKSVNDTSAEARYKSNLQQQQQQQQQLKEALRSPQSRDQLVRNAANYLLNTASKKQYSKRK